MEPRIWKTAYDWALLSVYVYGVISFFALFFSFCNLAPRAFSNHKWYREVFPAYPASRKALIPFLW